MGVYIKGMEMPFTCLTCDFHKCAGGVGDFCSLTKRRQFRFKNRPNDCPLIEVPEPHGRLIDAEQLKETLDYYIRESGWSDEINKAINWVKDEFINSEPTVIPASERNE